MAQKIRCGLRAGLVGAGRSRNGTGPFLAAHFEAAGGRIVAIAGRDQERAAAAASTLARRLGHAVVAHGSLAALLGEDLDALIIASPAPTHLLGLQAALAAGVPVLCEKPLLAPEHRQMLDPLLDGFLARGLLLLESCQWPENLPAWRELYPGRATAAVRTVAMQLSPATAEGMLEDSLSHLLSVMQALLPVATETELSGLRFSPTDGDTPGLTTEFTLEVGSSAAAPGVHAAGARVAGRLELLVCPEQPRPAWLSIDGARMDREIELATYRQSFRSAERSVCIGDPTAALVYRFAQAIREASTHDRIRTESELIRQRARIYHRVIDEFRRQFWRD